MPKFHLIILILIVLIAVTSVIFAIKTPEKPAQSSKPLPQSISIEEINDLIAQASNYEAKLKISSSSGKVYSGYAYVAPDKAKMIYESRGEIFVSNIDLNKKEIINYNLKNKMGVKMPSQAKEATSIFKKLPPDSEIIKENEVINGTNCFVIKIKGGDKTEILWISKKDGIIVKDQIIAPSEQTSFELTEIKKGETTESDLAVPEEIRIININSEEFIAFAENPDLSALVSLPALPQSSIEPLISSPKFPKDDQIAPSLSQQPTSSDYFLKKNDEGIYEETSPYLPPDILPIY